MPSKKIILTPYTIASKSLKLLQSKLNELLPYKVLRVRKDSTSYKQRHGRVYFNYGNSSIPVWNKLNPTYWFNKPEAVANASNKIKTFNILKAVSIPIPEYTTDRMVGGTWLANGSTVVNRAIINGHSGLGITLSKGDEPLPHVPLYVKYIPKEYEYRVHVFNGKVIDVQQKRKRTDYQGEVNNKIRNHHTGWVYCRHSYVPPPCIDDIKTQCIAAVKALGLDFGAVDVIYSKKNNKFYILEVNTAPGMTGETLNIYAKAIMEAV